MENELKQVIKFVFFNADPPDEFTSEGELIKELEGQAMLSVLGPKVQRLPFSKENQAYCFEYIMTVYAYMQELLYVQSELIDLFGRNGIPMAILKGSAAAMNYPYPLYRTPGDVDFIVGEADFSKAYELMLANGFKNYSAENLTEYHYALKKGKAIFELHKYPGGLPEGEKGDYLLGLIYKGLSDMAVTDIGGYRIPVLPVVPNGIVLLLHIRKHLTGGLGLRQITDWMLFVDKHLDDVAWENEFKIVASKGGLEDLAKTTTRMCQMHLGLREEITWCKDASEELCNDFWRYIVEKGNLGHKEAVDGLGRRFAEDGLFHPKKLLKKMQQDGARDWRLCQKHRWLKPFAWLRQLFYYASYVMRHRKRIAEDVKIGKERAKMIERLK